MRYKKWSIGVKHHFVSQAGMKQTHKDIPSACIESQHINFLLCQIVIQ